MKTLYTGNLEQLNAALAAMLALPETLPSKPDVRKFKSIIEAVAKLSKDPVKGVGSLILSPNRYKILATGYNGLPYGIPDDESLLNADFKNLLMMHSELNLIANAAESGVCTSGSILLCSKAPCHICAGAIVTAGISQVYTYRPSKESDWFASNQLGFEIFRRSRVSLTFME